MSGTGTPAAREGESYCAQMLRGASRDRYHACLMAPPGAREALFALHAFDHELARVREAASEPTLGLIRLQWWRDALEALAHGNVEAHPVMRTLADHGEDPAFRPYALSALIDAYEDDFEELPFETMEDLRANARARGLGVVRRAAKHLTGRDPEPDKDTPAARAVVSAATAWGLVLHLRAFGPQAHKGRCLAPRSVLEEAGIEAETVTSARTLTAPIKQVFEALLRQAAQEADRSARLERHVPKALTPALRHTRLAPVYLKLLRHKGYDPLRTQAVLPDYRRIWALMAPRWGGPGL